jgi:kinesin family protein 11
MFFPIPLQKKMQETECALAVLEEKYMQATNTIKEKEYLIDNLLKSGQNQILTSKFLLV